MRHTQTTSGVAAILAALALAAATGCGNEQPPAPAGGASAPTPAAAAGDDHGHEHADGQSHDDHDHDHEHDEVELGTITIGGHQVTLSQSHGSIQPGKELHLVVKLPYNDAGATIVRAWLGGEDRLDSIVARADYAASHDDYDVHAIAPDAIDETTMWWIELEMPDGTKAVGSIKPL